MHLRQCILFLISTMGLCSMAEASKLTVSRATSEPVKYVFRANCAVNGTVRVGQTCSTIWTVPPGWRYTVIKQSSDNDSVCFTSVDFTVSHNRGVGTVLNAGQRLKVTSTINRQITWLNSALCWVGYNVTAEMVDESGRNAYMQISSSATSDFSGVRQRQRVNQNNWTPEINYQSSASMAQAAAATGGIKSITLDVNDVIALKPGESKRLFTVDNMNTGTGTVRITKTGSVAPDIEVYKNGSTIAGCDGVFQYGGEYCDIRAHSSLGWYGSRNGVVNILLTIN